MATNVTNILDYRGYCIKNYNDNCIILTTHIPVFGCGAVWARIWRAGVYVDLDPLDPRPPRIERINDLT